MNAIPFKRRAATAAGSALPHLESFSDVAEATAVYAAAKATRRQREAELRQAQERLQAATALTDVELDAAAEAQLRGEQVDLRDLRVLVGDLVRAAAVARRAEDIARTALVEVRTRRAKQLASQLMPRYRAAVRAIALALHQVHEANRQAEEVRRELEGAGVSPHEASLLPMSFVAADLQGGWGHGSSPAEVWLGTVRHNGFIDADEALTDLARVGV